MSWRRALGLTVALALGAGMLVSAGPPAGAAGPTITLYNGQHPQTTDALVAAFEKKTGITVNVRNDDEDALADQIVAEGSHSPADVFYTENSPALEFLQGKGLLAPVDADHPGPGPGQLQLPAGRLGRGLGPGQRHWSTTPSLLSRASCPPRSCSWPTRVDRGSWPSPPAETDFQPIVTSVVAQANGDAATLALARRLSRPTPATTSTPTTRP